MHRLLAICVLLVSTTDGAHGHLFHRWLTRGQLPAPCQHAAASRDEALPTSAVDTAWSKVADGTGNSVMYFVETKQELFVFGKVPASTTTPGRTADTGAPSASTRAPVTRTSMSTTSTSAPATNVSASTTSSSAATTGTSATSESSNELLPSIPPGYTYYAATGSAYKFHFESDGVESWDDANFKCASEGAYMLVVNDAVEADIVTRVVRDATGSDFLTWTGLRDNRPGGVMEWRTVHGEPLSDVYNVWGDDEPANDTQYTCANFDPYDRLLHDVRCDWLYYYTCEISQ